MKGKIKENISFILNGKNIEGKFPTGAFLCDSLKELGDKSVRIGCQEGVCGACTVEINGLLTKSCLKLTNTCADSEIVTIAGLEDDPLTEKVKSSFTNCHALQCGYCTAGMIMSSRNVLKQYGDKLTESLVKDGLIGNICRCTGYKNIIHAVMHTAGKVQSLVELENKETDVSGKIGEAITRTEDGRLMSGRGKFTDNYFKNDDLFAYILRSDRAHAIIDKIDKRDAEKQPDVELILTGQEAQSHWDPISPTMDLLDLKLPKRYPIATDKVVFVGEPIVLIIARSQEAAQLAGEKVRIEYKDLPINTKACDSLKAKEDGILYDSWDNNVQIDFNFENGELENVFSSADLIVEETIDSHRFGAMPMETRAVRADFDSFEKSLIVHASTQVPHQFRIYLSRVFGLKENSIQIIAGDVGGGFGSKLSMDTEYLPILGSIILGKPVRWHESRTEWIHAGFGARDYTAKVKGAFDKSGKLKALETDIIADMGCDGAERACGLGMPLNGGTFALGPYVCENYKTRVRCVVTNKAPYNAYRGFGKDLANMLIERTLDIAADKLEMDQILIRKKNLLKSYPHQIVTGPILENGTQRECLERLEQIMNISALRETQSQALSNNRFLGISLIPYIEPAGATFPSSAFQNYESVNVRVAADGSVQVQTGIQSIGQGIETVYAQVTAEYLGCSVEDVGVSWGDTNVTPWGSGTFSSRGAMFAVGAIIKAATKIKKRIEIASAILLNCDKEALLFENGKITNKITDKSISFKELSYAVYVNPGAEIILDQADEPSLEAMGTYRHPQVNWKADELGRAQFYPAHSNGAEGALVEVDPNTGDVRVLKIWIVADHGKILNPLLLKGQITGGIMQQLGGTLYEKFDYDSEGRPLQKTLKEYGIPNIWSTPEIEIHHLETKSPSTEVGAKGGGEDGCIATSTAIMGAVEDALRPIGVKITTSDLSPKNLKKIIEENRI